MEGVGSANGLFPNGTGLEARWMGEVGHAVARQNLSFEEANLLINNLLALYEHVFKVKGCNPGFPIDQAYDLTTLTPVPAWQTLYREVKTELIAMGLSAL